VAALKAKSHVRLERGEGASRSFWEISRNRGVVTTRFGRHLGAGRTVVKEHESAADAAKVFDKAVEEKRKEGYSDPVVRAEAGASSRKGVSAQSPELEALIEEEPSDPERYLVYADWLQQQGDPRGELIVIQYRLATTDDDRTLGALERDEATLFKKYEDELLGPLATFTFHRTSHRSYRTFSWRYGFIRAARLSRLYHQFDEVHRLLLEHPAARFLERILYPSLREPERVLDVLRRRAPATLRSIVVADEDHEGSSLRGFWQVLPQLRVLGVNRAIDDLGDVEAPSLEELHLAHANNRALAAVGRASWPSLKRLHLTLPEADSSAIVASLLRGGAMPMLEHVTVRRWIVRAQGGREGLAPQDELALELVRAAADRGLARLDLEMVLSAEGAKALLSTPSTLEKIRALHIPSTTVDQGVRAALSRVHPGIAWTGPPEEEEFDLTPIDTSSLVSAVS
jgi:uncharacterized protein (TIGR02996 family)